ncbi:hypothetical protein BC828DRAFT_419731 [Blastocladiella britannica]|nr:hypothetical protein BC828DRAFT_419731 [Blastocladiella britannica]
MDILDPDAFTSDAQLADLPPTLGSGHHQDGRSDVPSYLRPACRGVRWGEGVVLACLNSDVNAQDLFAVLRNEALWRPLTVAITVPSGYLTPTNVGVGAPIAAWEFDPHVKCVLSEVIDAVCSVQPTGAFMCHLTGLEFGVRDLLQPYAVMWFVPGKGQHKGHTTLDCTVAAAHNLCTTATTNTTTTAASAPRDSHEQRSGNGHGRCGWHRQPDRYLHTTRSTPAASNGHREGRDYPRPSVSVAVGLDDSFPPGSAIAGSAAVSSLAQCEYCAKVDGLAADSHNHELADCHQVRNMSTIAQALEKCHQEVQCWRCLAATRLW